MMYEIDVGYLSSHTDGVSCTMKQLFLLISYGYYFGRLAFLSLDAKKDEDGVADAEITRYLNFKCQR